MHRRFFPERLRLALRIAGQAAIIAIGVELFSRSMVSAPTAGATSGDPVVLELFTSQGCSDCPPADAQLNELGASTAGVIPLAYHVDYWNHLGWSDPFSSAQFSERQEDYAHALKINAPYTPQIVIGGATQFVGSDRSSIARALTEAQTAPALGHVGLRTSLAGQAPRSLQVKLKAQVGSSAPGPFVVMVAVYENGLVTRVGAGENGGRELKDDYTVRKLVRAFAIEGTQAVEKEVTVDLDPTWSVDRLGAAAFIQNTSSLKIIGATAQYPIG